MRRHLGGASAIGSWVRLGSPRRCGECLVVLLGRLLLTHCLSLSAALWLHLQQQVPDMMLGRVLAYDLLGSTRSGRRLSASDP